MAQLVSTADWQIDDAQAHCRPTSPARYPEACIPSATLASLGSPSQLCAFNWSHPTATDAGATKPRRYILNPLVYSFMAGMRLAAEQSASLVAAEPTTKKVEGTRSFSVAHAHKSGCDPSALLVSEDVSRAVQSEFFASQILSFSFMLFGSRKILARIYGFSYKLRRRSIYFPRSINSCSPNRKSPHRQAFFSPARSQYIHLISRIKTMKGLSHKASYSDRLIMAKYF